MEVINKKILIITPGFPKDEQDSSCVPYIQDYLIALSKDIGAENIKVISTQYPYTKKKYTWNNIEVYPAGGENKKSFHYYFTLRRSMKNIAQLMDNDDYVIHAFWLGEAAFLGNRALKKYFTHAIITLMGQDVKPGNRAMRYLDRDHNFFVALSDNQEKIFFENYNVNADAIIPFPIPKIDQHSNPEQKTIDLLFAGSIIDVKQPAQFVEIVKTLKQDFPNIKAVMAGGGNLLDAMRALVDTEGLSENITITGAISREEMFLNMANSIILIHTSQFEGQCVVYAEALAHGMYILSYNVGRIENTENHVVCNSKEEIIKNGRKLLSSSLNFMPINAINAEETVQAYKKLYFPEK